MTSPGIVAASGGTSGGGFATPARVGAITTTGSTATTRATAYTQSPTAGNMLICSLGLSKASGEPTITFRSNGTGWVLVGKIWANHSTGGGGAYLYAKAAAGGDAAPEFESTASVTWTYSMEEWSGLDNTYIPTSALTDSDVTAGTDRPLSVDLTAGSIPEFKFGVGAGRTGSGGVTPTQIEWSNLTENLDTASGRSAWLMTATGLLGALASETVGMTVDNSQGDGMNGLVVGQFRRKAL